MDYPIKVSFALSARRKLIAGMMTPQFIDKRPYDINEWDGVDDGGVLGVPRVNKEHWIGVRDRLCARFTGHSRGRVATLVLIGDMDIQALLAAIKHNPISKKGMQREFEKVNRIAKEAKVSLMDDP